MDQNGGFFRMESPIETDDLRVPPVQETSTWGNEWILKGFRDCSGEIQSRPHCSSSLEIIGECHELQFTQTCSLKSFHVDSGNYSFK